MRLRTVLLSVAIAAVVAAPAKADTKFALSGEFDDGGALGGSFSLDVYGFLSSLDITTPAGSTLSGYTYDFTTAYGSGCTGADSANCIPLGTRVPAAYYGGLQLSFQNPLGSVSVDPILGGEGGPSWENSAWGSEIRYITTGSATIVPEPATWALTIAGFVGLGFAGYRQARFARAIA